MSDRYTDRQYEMAISKIVFEDEPPRFKGCPRICSMENLPAFNRRDDVFVFKEQFRPSSRIDRVWECRHCKCWHFEAHSAGPSGDSSGTSTRHLT